LFGYRLTKVVGKGRNAALTRKVITQKGDLLYFCNRINDKYLSSPLEDSTNAWVARNAGRDIHSLPETKAAQEYSQEHLPPERRKRKLRSVSLCDNPISMTTTAGAAGLIRTGQIFFLRDTAQLKGFADHFVDAILHLIHLTLKFNEVLRHRIVEEVKTHFFKFINFGITQGHILRLPLTQGATTVTDLAVLFLGHLIRQKTFNLATAVPEAAVLKQGFTELTGFLKDKILCIGGGNHVHGNN
jgi:hypothetical protein